MTNGELFIRENPTVETKLNGSCVWIYYPDGVNHYTMPTSWWEQEISLFDKIRAEIEAIDTVKVKLCDCMNIIKSPQRIKDEVLGIIDKYKAERSDKE